MILLIVLISAGLSMGQTVTGAITGSVVDASASVIPGATVTLLNERTGDSRSLVSDEFGSGETIIATGVSPWN